MSRAITSWLSHVVVAIAVVGCGSDSMDPGSGAGGVAGAGGHAASPSGGAAGVGGHSGAAGSGGGGAGGIGGVGGAAAVSVRGGLTEGAPLTAGNIAVRSPSFGWSRACVGTTCVTGGF